MDNFNMEEIRADKKALEVKIFDLLDDFENMHGLKIKDISLIIIESCLNPGMNEKEYEQWKSGKDKKLTGIELTINL